jgi:hypothetical protein
MYFVWSREAFWRLRKEGGTPVAVAYGWKTAFLSSREDPCVADDGRQKCPVTGFGRTLPASAASAFNSEISIWDCLKSLLYEVSRLGAGTARSHAARWR